jgi:glycosyltransferase involved in cell wall biosynthesis
LGNQTLVSIVIIFLNAERFIHEAIQSVFAQTYPAWELLLVDDGSNDESTAIAHQYALRHPKQVSYLEHPGHANRGMSASRNLGIRHANGEYIAFLDADDAWFPYTLQEQVAILEAHHQSAMVYGPLQWWYSWTGIPEDTQRDYVEKLGVPPGRLIKPPRLLPLFLQDKAAVPSGILVRREAIERVGGFEDEFRGEYEDQVFSAKVCLHAPVFASGRCWYRYRQHPESSVMIGQKTGQTHAARLAFLNWLTQYLGEHRITHPGVRWALWLELVPYKHKKLYWLLERIRYYVDRSKYWLRIATI